MCADKNNEVLTLLKKYFTISLNFFACVHAVVRGWYAPHCLGDTLACLGGFFMTWMERGGGETACRWLLAERACGTRTGGVARSLSATHLRVGGSPERQSPPLKLARKKSTPDLVCRASLKGRAAAPGESKK